MLGLLSILFSLSLCVINCQNIEVAGVVDAWGDSEPLLLATTIAAPPTISVERAILSQNAIGGERDIEIVTSSSPSNTVAFAHVGPDSFSFAAPSVMTGTIYLHYDGMDGSSNLDVNGLNEMDFTQNEGNQFLLRLACDIGAVVTLNVYSGNNISSYDLNVDNSLILQDFLVPFSEFRGDANFSSVGALELVINFEDNLDITIEDFLIMRPAVNSAIEESPATEIVEEPTSQCFEFVHPIEEEFIDYNLSCTRKPFQNANSPAPALFVNFSLVIFIFIFL